MIVLSLCEQEKMFTISESALPGTFIGTISSTLLSGRTPNFYIVWPDLSLSGENTILINDITGEITVLGELDYEKKNKYTFLAIPTDGSITTRVIIQLLNVNDNSPIFPVDHITLEISEYARLNSQLALPLATDADEGIYGVQKYNIIGGNVNNVFKLSQRNLQNVIYVDLTVNGQLDREYRNRYELTIEAEDGGDPPKKGKLDVTIIILDANDNAPIFGKTKYTGTISSNASVDDVILIVNANDIDEGENGRISYKIIENHDRSNKIFKIDEDKGIISVAQTTTFIPGTSYEFHVMAQDHGLPQKLENTVPVKIEVNHDNKAFETTLDIVWLTESGLPKIAEHTTIGYIFGRISVKDMSSSHTLSLSGSESICLRQSDKPSVFLLVVCGILDREIKNSFLLKFIYKNVKTGEIIFDHPIHFTILDENDNPPVFGQKNYIIKLNEETDEIPPILAKDIDEGENGKIYYSLIGSDYFKINPESGLIQKIKDFDCSVGNEINFKIKATDNGKTKLSSVANVIIDISSLNTKSPSFERSLYEVFIKENLKEGSCFIKTHNIGIFDDPNTYSFISFTMKIHYSVS
ncbi:Cadherin domain and Cadherin-like domain-containing protein [Strongyloides ratti]|uniref:Cadherin domain and Cadherin-like domain-containing protein n=1 Tax=Strongyloides ratti TaxID=34506 RepID=A0A090LJ75_STRRB|nr:Cadherin domain and Cadherin-like domain-containing protein [Strongyloides ratti]CEF67590.1 Cadherin domain and Cadherin-like domain-containing protein [Strongyloides ratti]